jgi:hypothetical protein
MEPFSVEGAVAAAGARSSSPPPVEGATSASFPMMQPTQTEAGLGGGGGETTEVAWRVFPRPGQEYSHNTIAGQQAGEHLPTVFCKGTLARNSAGVLCVVRVGSYPIVTFQCSSTTLYQVSYHTQYLFF